MSDVDMLIRLLSAALLGSIGLEPERILWAAGIRTHMLVCVGSCLIMIVSQYGFANFLIEKNVVLDPLAYRSPGRLGNWISRRRLDPRPRRDRQGIDHGGQHLDRRGDRSGGRRRALSRSRHIDHHHPDHPRRHQVAGRAYRSHN
jgi:hypothetical protein